jgi:hypothetical protein
LRRSPVKSSIEPPTTPASAARAIAFAAGLRIVRAAILQIGVDREVGGVSDHPAILDDGIEPGGGAAERVGKTEARGSRAPRNHRSRAVLRAGVQGLGMMKAPAAHAARETVLLFPFGCALITPLWLGRFWLAAKLAGCRASAKSVISFYIISLLHGSDMDSDALHTFLTVSSPRRHFECAKALHRSQRQYRGGLRCWSRIWACRCSSE